MNRLQLPVGGVFAYTKQGEELQALLIRVAEIPTDPMALSCEGCVFGGTGMCEHIACSPHERTDAKNVKFLEVKGGEE